MSEVVEITKILSPAIQVICGGLIALLGSVIVQRKTHNNEKHKFHREIIQTCYRSLLEVDDILVDEKVSIQKLLRNDEHQQHWLAETQKHSRALDDHIKQLELNINLYLPKVVNAFLNYHEVISNIYMLNAKALTERKSISQDEFCIQHKEYENKYQDTYIELRSKLESNVAKFT